MRFAVCVVALLAGWPAFAVEPRESAPGSADPQALTILHDLSHFYSKLSAFSVTVKVNDVGITDSTVALRQSTVQMVFQRPFKLVIKSLHPETGALETLIVCDGRELYTYRRPSNGWVVMSAPKTIDEMWLGIRDVVVEDALPFLMEFCREEPFVRWTKNIRDGRFKGVESGSGFPRRSAAYTVRNVGRIKLLDIDLVVDDLEGVYPSRLSARNPDDVPCYRGSLGEDFSVDIQFSNWNPSPEIKDDTFRWNPPEGAVEIMHLP